MFSLKTILGGAVLVTILLLAVVWADNTRDNQERPAPGEDEVCIQVITPARNPQTGEIADFPTPCDVPEGWEVVQGD